MNWLSKLLNKVFKIREHSDGDIIKPFLEHMEDLRWTLLKMGFSLIAAMVIAFFYRNDLMRILQAPLAQVDPSLPGQLIVTEIAGAFMLSIKMAFQAGIVIFSGSLYVLALTGIKGLGAVTPIGGLAFLAGWAMLAWSAWRG